MIKQPVLNLSVLLPSVFQDRLDMGHNWKIIPRQELNPGPPTPQSATLPSVLSHHISLEGSDPSFRRHVSKSKDWWESWSQLKFIYGKCHSQSNHTKIFLYLPFRLFPKFIFLANFVIQIWVRRDKIHLKHKTQDSTLIPDAWMWPIDKGPIK